MSVTASLESILLGQFAFQPLGLSVEFLDAQVQESIDRRNRLPEQPLACSSLRMAASRSWLTCWYFCCH
jgi:hypothetical protein